MTARGRKSALRVLLDAQPDMQVAGEAENGHESTEAISRAQER